MLNQVLTKKQTEVLTELNFADDWFIAILHGAKRSGKTFINNIQFLQELRRVRKNADKNNIKTPLYILAGFSMSNIQDNILNELYNTFGLSVKFDRYNSFELFGVKVIQTTHGNIQGVGRIRGMTAHGAYVNEASLANEAVIEEIISRCSGEGARILMDTNPDHPEHWLKKNYIDNPDKTVKNFHFIIDDNTFLEARYVESMKAATPTGMFYDRSILGLWVSADGVVYQDFDKTRDCTDIDTYQWWNAEEVICGVDWGYEHYGSIVVLGRFGDKWVLLEEYAEQHREIDFWVMIAHDIVRRYKNPPFYCDSARPEHVDRFVREGFRAINADKSVLSGIESVATLIKENKFRVIEEKCPHFMKEVYSYIWNERTGMPMKENDDVMDSLRYAIYTHRNKPVEWKVSPTFF